MSLDLFPHLLGTLANKLKQISTLWFSTTGCNLEQVLITDGTIDMERQDRFIGYKNTGLALAIRSPKQTHIGETDCPQSLIVETWHRDQNGL